jgi:hypothetical protein
MVHFGLFLTCTWHAHAPGSPPGVASRYTRLENRFFTFPLVFLDNELTSSQLGHFGKLFN